MKEDSCSESEISTSFYEISSNFHRPVVKISGDSTSFLHTLHALIPKMSLEDLRKELTASLAREESVRQELMEIKNHLKTLNINPTPSAPTEEEIASETSKITFNRRKEIKEYLSEIREYDGTTDVEAFLTQCRRIMKQLNGDGEKLILLNKIIATKLKGEAIAVADRMTEITPKDFSEAMKLAFGKTEKDYSQLIEERNSLRQGLTERIDNFIRRYVDIDKRIQRSIDQVDIEFRPVYRKIEDKERIGRFIRALKPEIKHLIMTKNPSTLNEAYQNAMYEEKIYRDDELLRSRQRIKINDSNDKNSNKKSVESQNQHSQPKQRIGCNHCKSSTHSEEKCYIKHPHLRPNFHSNITRNKDPPRNIHEMQESSIIPPEPEESEMNQPSSNEPIQYCSRDLEEQQPQMDSW